MMSFSKSLKYSTAVAGITALLAVPFIVGDVVAAEDNSRAKLQSEQTASNGRVKLTGTIDNIYSNRNFTLRDHRGNTIQVRSDRKMELREGDRVEIIGRVAATDVKVLNRDNNDNMSSNTRRYNSIEELPEEGQVSLVGTVTDDVEAGDRSLVIRDMNDDTIDVHFETDLDLTEGSTVRVTGTIEDEALGFGEQIVSARVEVTDQAADDSARNSNMDRDNVRNSRDMNADRNGSDEEQNRQMAAREKSGKDDAVMDAYRDAKENLDANKNGKKVSAIDALPQKGNVMISGVVSSVEKEDQSFTLKDDSGQTIDVHTGERVRVTKGDMVRVEGIMKDEALGLGEQIVKARVKITKRGNPANAEQNKKRSDIDNKAYQQRADRQSNEKGLLEKVASVTGGDNDGQVTLSGMITSVDKGERKFNLRDTSGAEIEVHTSHAFTLRKGDRVEVTGKAANIVAAKAELVARAGDNVARRDDTARNGREYSAIEALPQEGNVMITGTVDSVERSDGRFILRDKSGATIDVHSEGELNLTKGALVRVNGVMSDEALGLGEQIVSARVQVVNKN